MGARWLGAVWLALAMAWNPIAPPEHVHESDEHGAPHAVVHRHLESQFGAHHHPEEHGGVIDHGDDRSFTFDSSVALASSFHAIGKPVPAVSLLTLDPPAPSVADGRRDHVERLSHSPPRAPTGLRAPPRVTHL